MLDDFGYGYDSLGLYLRQGTPTQNDEDTICPSLRLRLLSLQLLLLLRLVLVLRVVVVVVVVVVMAVATVAQALLPLLPL